MSRSLAATAPRSPLEAGDRALQGVSDPEDATDETHAATIRDRMYEITRDAVDVWGGPMALASYWRCAFSNISARLNRREVNGQTQHIFLDHLAIALTAPAAAESFVYSICDLFGFEHPKKKRMKTDPEKLAALVKSLRAAGPLGEAAIKQAARAMGADPAEFDL